MESRFRAVVALSDRFRGQFVVYTDDPSFTLRYGATKLFAPDGTIMNQDQVGSICNMLAGEYDLSMTRDAIERMNSILDESPVNTPSLTPPDGMTHKAFQRRCVHALSSEERAMIQSSCGTGKSFLGTTLACLRFDANEIDRLVIWCPSALVSDWVSNIKRLTSLTVATVNKSMPTDKRAQFYRSSTAQVWVLNYERMRTKDSVEIERSLKGMRLMFLFDEIQKLKNRSSDVHRKMRLMVNHVDPKYRVALTATPIVTGPEDLYNEWRILDPDVYGNVKDFEREYTYDNGARDFFRNYIGYQNLEYMHCKVGARTFSADKSQPEIAAEFPQRNEILMRLDLSPQERSVYDEIVEYGRSLLPDERQGALFFFELCRLCNMPEAMLDVPIPDGLSPYSEQAMRIREICEAKRNVLSQSKFSSKLALVTEKVDELVSAGERVIIFANHTRNCLFPLAAHLAKMGPLLYVGGMSEQERVEVRDAFRSGRSRLLLMSDAGQVGLNFQECSSLIHYQTPITHAAYTQRSDRVHRIDSKSDRVDIYRMVTGGTVEERIEDTMQGRRELAETMGFGMDFEEYGSISGADASWLCGF
jgi:SNF2 family DNA or RNA helicase